ncbi:GlsB/YeaQ/YmgE family stress response membrane protein [Thiothrix subterranea]|uniref:GlsB/YeaQ/YmgE family stress response membrane protein n=1 Tax=Thiothrix subterranea TaxID=2735563 RepID=UPI00192AC48A|nr:GlsB/YeaQ/YmgE family stress response membrane protein [Thiothrix subterranea]QQZ28225.1 GlsB/YeaQ/YmgE family stress response membrane protein [Thiothrix subterranea]
MSAEITQILIMLGIGAVAGWLAGIIMKGAGFGLIGNIIVGIVGAFIGGFVGTFIEGAAGFHIPDIWGAIVWATVGAVILLFIIRLIKRA